MSTDVTLRVSDQDGAVEVDVAVAAGGRIRQITIESDGERVELLIDAPADAPAWSKEWGLYPMAPWAGRLRNGRFEHDGAAVALALNHEDSDGAGGGTIRPPKPAMVEGVDPDHPRRHSIHGVVYTLPWTVEQCTDRSITMSRSLVDDSPTSLGWPFGGTATQVISLGPNRVDLELAVTASDGTSFPAALGWHPWFAKPARVDFSPSQMYEVGETGLPTGRLVAPPSGPFDDCFTNTEPAQLIYERTVAPTVTVTSDCDHLVVFDMLDAATCVEPQSGPPDAPNVQPTVLAPGSTLRRTMSLAW